MPPATLDVIAALSRCVQITLTDPPTREYFEQTDPQFLLQARAALDLEAGWRADLGVRVVDNFDDVPAVLDELHAFYEAADTAETYEAADGIETFDRDH